MKKKLLMLILGGTLVLGLVTGCTESKTNEPKEKEKETQETSKGKCEVEECINLIEPKMTVEEVNEIIGFEGEKKDDTNTYIWQLTTKTKIEIEYKDNLGTISATMNKEKMENANLKMSICYEIVNNIKTTTYTYEEMVEKLEGIEGHLTTKAPTFKMYAWVKDGQTFRATFSDSIKGKSSIVSIR